MTELVVLIFVVLMGVTNTNELFKQNSFYERILVPVIITSYFLALYFSSSVAKIYLKIVIF